MSTAYIAWCEYIFFNTSINFWCILIITNELSNFHYVSACLSMQGWSEWYIGLTQIFLSLTLPLLFCCNTICKHFECRSEIPFLQIQFFYHTILKHVIHMLTFYESKWLIPIISALQQKNISVMSLTKDISTSCRLIKCALVPANICLILLHIEVFTPLKSILLNIEHINNRDAFSSI